MKPTFPGAEVMKKLVILVIATSVCCTTTYAQVICTYDFDGNLEPRSGFPCETLVTGEFIAFETGLIFGERAPVARFLRAGRELFGANAGRPQRRRRLRQYTLIYDVWFPFAPWISLLQTNATNSNDGDGFISGGNGGASVSLKTTRTWETHCGSFSASGVA